MQAIGSIEGSARARRFLTRAREKWSRDASDRTTRSPLPASDLRPVVREAQKSDDVDHAGDDAEQRWESPAQDFDRVAAAPRLSMTTRGIMRPKLIAKMIVMAVNSSPIVWAKRLRDAV